MAITGTGTTIDLTAARGRLDGIERIDLGAAGDQTLILTRLDVLNLSPDSNTLIVFGGAGADVVRTTGDNWFFEGTELIDLRTFDKYTDGRAILFIEDTIIPQIGPVVLPHAVNIDENSANGVSVGFVPAVDPDGGTLSNYAILAGNTGGVFAIDGPTGEITVAGPLDFETLSAYTLTVQVSDNDGLIGVGTFEVAVNDVNEAPQIDQSQISVSIAEHTATGTVIATVTVTDVDAGDVMTFSIGDSLSGASFTDRLGIDINSATGEIVVSDATLLDFETDTQREFSVNVEDLGGLRATAIQVEISLTDVTNFVAPFNFTLTTQTPKALFAVLDAFEPSPISATLLTERGSPTEVDFGAGVLTFDMGIETTMSAEITTSSGDVNASLPFTVEVTMPDEISLGQEFIIQSSFVLGEAATISGNSSAYRAIISQETKNLSLRADISGIVSGTIFDITVDDFTLTREYGDGPIPYEGTPTSAGSLEIKLPSPITVQVFQEVDFDSAYLTELNKRGIPNDGFGTIEFPIPFSPTADVVRVDYVTLSTGNTGTVNILQDISLLVDALVGTITLEDGTTISGWNIGDDLAITLDPASDVNPVDGRVDFEITFAVDATLSNANQYQLVMRFDFDAGAFKATRVDNTTFPATETVLMDRGQLIDTGYELTGTSGPPDVRSFTLTGFDTHTGMGAIDLVSVGSKSMMSSLVAKSGAADRESDTNDREIEDDVDDVMAGSIHEPVIPFRIAEGLLRAAQAGAALALRLRGDEPIAPESIWALVPEAYVDRVTIEWQPAVEGDFTDVWVIIRPAGFWDLDDTVSVDAGAEPGIEAGAEFRIESREQFDAGQNVLDSGIWQPLPDRDFDADGVDTASESSDGVIVVEGTDVEHSPLAIGVGTPFTIMPEQVYSQPQRVWLPIPEGIDPASVRLYYYHGTGEGVGWYAADAVEGWLVPDSELYLELEGSAYFGFLVRHTAIVQLGVPTEP